MTTSRTPWLLGALVLVVLGGAAVWWSTQRGAESAPPVALPAATVADDSIDPANDERTVSLSGQLVIDAGAVDPELGIRSAAAVLFRDVEMYQWQEQCVADACGQNGVWSATRIDSSTFRERAGHENPADLPFTSKRFDARSLRVGAFAIEPDVFDDGEAASHAVSVRDLQPNLAAIFRDNDGSLYSGEDAQKPAIGDLRVRYRVIRSGAVRVTGVQRGNRLVHVATPSAPATTAN